VLEAALPKRLIFFARAARDERRRSRMEGGGWLVGDGLLRALVGPAGTLLLALGGLCCNDARIAACFIIRDGLCNFFRKLYREMEKVYWRAAYGVI